MNKKRLVSLCIVAAMMLTAIAGGTLAYFTDKDYATNVFTVGNVKIDLTEPNWEETGKAEAQDSYPGEALAKDPTVTNNGDNPCFVRIKVTGWDCLAPAGNITYKTDYVPGALGENWVYDAATDYFYYTAVLESGATTDALFDQIVMPTDLTNGYDGEYALVVTAEAVQAQGANGYNWAGVTGTVAKSTTELAKWFTTCGM